MRFRWFENLSENLEMEKSHMRQAKLNQAKLNIDNFHGANLPKLAPKLAVVAIVLVMCFPIGLMAQQPGQKTFSSAQAASKALAAAAESNDDKAMLEILGPDGQGIVSSGDATEDAENRANFAQRYRQMHRLVKEADGTTVLYIGAHNWPTPIPLMNKGNVWYFDTEAGQKEIIYRRVGRNEMSAIHVCQELVTAQKEYSAQHGEFARKIFSDAGQQNGLYWKTANGQPQSPIGPLVASAVAKDYAGSQNGAPTPYRGYYFHILVGQGKNGPGGAKKSYIVNGKMTDGFAFVAYPAEYRSSGVMTFVVDQDGVVYEKDLGNKTEVRAKEMKEYDPSAAWQKAEQQTEQAATQAGK
jgi:hypothetical protein